MSIKEGKKFYKRNCKI